MTASPPRIVLPRMALLGAGSMGGAILSGLIASAAPHAGVVVTNRTAAKADAIVGALGGGRLDGGGLDGGLGDGGPADGAPADGGVVSVALERDPDGNRTAVRGAGLVVLGVKPAGIPELLSAIRDDLEPDAVVVSIAAGVTIATMEALVPNPVLRAMPSTPSLVRLGVTGLAAGSRVTGEQAAIARTLFETVGAVVELPEDRIDALSAVSGSGPAYVFLFIEEWTAAAVRLGFDEASARLLVEQTVRGASELLAASDVGPAELRRRVTSPKGTTERAIAVLEEADLAGLFGRAMDAAIERSGQLARGEA